LQRYLFFPALLKVCVYLCPLPKRPESNLLGLSAVAVCGALSLLIHLTLIPRLIVMLAGLKRKSWIKTVLVGCLCALALGCLCAPTADTTNNVLTRTSAATVINKIMRFISVTSFSYFSRPTAEICA
jgi:ABC-type Co2+ transport system permease subunit